MSFYKVISCFLLTILPVLAATPPRMPPPMQTPFGSSNQGEEVKPIVVNDIQKAPSFALVTDVIKMPLIDLETRDTDVIQLKEPAEQIFVTDPKILDVQLTTPTLLYVYGKSVGQTTMMVANKDRSKVYEYEVNVKYDHSEIQRLIASIAPNEKVQVDSAPGTIILTGEVSSSRIAEDIRTLVSRFVSKSDMVLNHLKVKAQTQVYLKVKIAEVRRSIINTMNINWVGVNNHHNFRFGYAGGRSNFLGSGVDVNANLLRTGRFAAVNGGSGEFTFPNGDPTADPLKSFGLRFRDSVNDFASMIDVLASESLASILAEPTLVTLSGEEASFLAGGEVPIPQVQGSANNPLLGFQFKQIGVSLSFVPVVMGNTISLRVRPEVTDLDRSIRVRDTFENRIFGTRTRRAESTMELGNGESIIMAGLLSSDNSAEIEAVPGLGDIPIIGTLFRSNDFRDHKTELVIIVTPYIVEPTSETSTLSMPTDGLQYVSFLDMIINRQLTKTSGTDNVTRPKFTGAAGYFF
ncbi:MAG: type II and III secretion system protein family protein [Proteobacteria bacterium]|nr:type II and III secretion system protein family protein [Pseudomonadota bacterium]